MKEYTVLIMAKGLPENLFRDLQTFYQIKNMAERYHAPNSMGLLPNLFSSSIDVHAGPAQPNRP